MLFIFLDRRVYEFAVRDAGRDPGAAGLPARQRARGIGWGGGGLVWGSHPKEKNRSG